MRPLLCLLISLCLLAAAPGSVRAQPADPEQQAVTEALLLAAGQAERAHDPEQVRFALALAQALSPSPERLLRLIHTYRRQGAEAEALALCARLPEVPPDLSAWRAQVYQGGPSPPSPGTAGRAVYQGGPSPPSPGTAGRASPPAPLTVAQAIERGHILFQAGRYPQAAEAYALLYGLRPLPRVLFNIGQALRRAGRVREALAFYRRFLSQEPPGPLQKEAEGYVRELQAMHRPPVKPLFRRPWFWLTLSGVALGVVTIGLGIGLSRPGPQPPTTPRIPIDVMFP